MVHGVGDHQHKQATVRRGEFATEVHRQRAGQGATGDAGRNHAQRVFGRKRDRPFGDKAQAQNHRGLACLALGLGELAPRQERGDAHANRRHHTGGHGRRHRRAARGRQQANRKGVRRLVDRPTQIHTHHAAQQDAQQHRVGGAHGAEEVSQAGEQSRDRRADEIDHRQARKQTRQQRDDQNRLERL